MYCFFLFKKDIAADGDDDLDARECRYINHGPKGISIQVETSLRRVGWNHGRRGVSINQEDLIFFLFFLRSSIFGIIKSIYNDIPFPSAFQKSMSSVF